MPAKKIIEAVASTFSVIGSSMATAVAGPWPGNTPTAVPMESNCRSVIKTVRRNADCEAPPAAHRHGTTAVARQSQLAQLLDTDNVRIDKWLWVARFFKTRGLAAEDIGKGRLSVNGQVVKASRELRPGDQLAWRHDGSTRTFIVEGLSMQRGPSEVAKSLYAETPESIALRTLRALERRVNADPATSIEQGRPTKRDRRELADWNRWSASADDGK